MWRIPQPAQEAGRQQLSTVQRTSASVGPRPRGRSGSPANASGSCSHQTSKHQSGSSASRRRSPRPNPGSRAKNRSRLWDRSPCDPGKVVWAGNNSRGLLRDNQPYQTATKPRLHNHLCLDTRAVTAAYRRSGLTHGLPSVLLTVFCRSRHAMLASVSDFSQGALVDDGRFSPKPRSLCAVRRKLDLEDFA